jgi:hypothetical protein
MRDRVTESAASPGCIGGTKPVGAVWLSILFNIPSSSDRSKASPGLESILDYVTASRIAWFLVDHLGVPMEEKSKWMPDRTPADSILRPNFFYWFPLPWHLAELTRSGRPDSMDPFEQMEVVLLQRPECSIAWMPEDEFQVTFGWGNPLQAEKKT